METPTRSPELTEDHSFENAMLVDSVEVLRRRQFDAMNEESISDAEKAAKIEQLIEEYIDIFNKGADSDKVDQMRNKLRELSVDKIDDFKWRYGEWTDSSKTKVGPLGVDHVYKAQEELFGRVIEYDFDADEETKPADVDIEEERRVEKLEQLKTAKHEAYVNKVTGRRFGEKARLASAAYEKAEAKYAEALNEDIRLQLERELGDEVDQEQIDESIQEIGEDILRKDAEEEYALLMERGGRTARMLAKYDKLSIGKKLAFGAGVAGVGLAGGFLAGALGAGAVVVGASVAGYRVGTSAVTSRLLSRARAYREPSSDTGFTYDKESEYSAEQQITARMSERSRLNLEHIDQNKKRGLFMGLGAAGIAAVSGTAGVLAHIGIADLPSADLSTDNSVRKGKHWGTGYIGHMLEGNEASGLDGSDATEDVDRGFVEGARGGTLLNSVDDASLYPTAEPTVEQPAVAAPAPADANIQLASDGELFTAEQAELEIPAYTVSAGESWTTAMTNLGVEPDRIPELLKDLGPQLEEMGVAYEMEYLWGISEAGELPHEATELIMTTAHENGWLNDAALEHGFELPVVPDGGGMNEFVNTNYDHTLSHEESLGLGEHLESSPDTADFLYQSDYLLNTFDNPHGISEPGMINPAVDEAIREYVGGLDGAESQVVGVSNANQGVDLGTYEPAGVANAETSAELGRTEVAAETETAPQVEQPAVVEQPVESDNVYTTDDTGVDVDDESLSPTPETDAEVTELTGYQERMLQNTLGGNFSNLNNLDVLFPQLATEYQFANLAAALEGETFTDGTAVVESGTGLFSSGPQFNDVPEGAQLRPGTLGTINSHLNRVGLGEYQLSQSSAGLQIGA